MNTIRQRKKDQTDNGISILTDCHNVGCGYCGQDSLLRREQRCRLSINVQTAPDSRLEPQKREWAGIGFLYSCSDMLTGNTKGVN